MRTLVIIWHMGFHYCLVPRPPGLFFFSALLEVISLLSDYSGQLKREFASAQVLSRDHQ